VAEVVAAQLGSGLRYILTISDQLTGDLTADSSWLERVRRIHDERHKRTGLTSVLSVRAACPVIL